MEKEKGERGKGKGGSRLWDPKFNFLCTFWLETSTGVHNEKTGGGGLLLTGPALRLKKPFWVILEWFWDLF